MFENNITTVALTTNPVVCKNKKNKILKHNLKFEMQKSAHTSFKLAFYNLIPTNMSLNLKVESNNTR